MHIVVQKDRLHHGLNFILFNAFQQRPVCDLTVNQCVPQGIFPVPQDLFITVHRVGDGLVADGMGHYLHIIPICQRAEGIYLFRRHGFHAEIARIVQVFLTHGCGAGAQRAVLEQLQRAKSQAVVFAEVLGFVALRPTRKGVGRGKAHLMAIAQGAKLFFIDIPYDTEHRARRYRSGTCIVGLH